MARRDDYDYGLADDAEVWCAALFICCCDESLPSHCAQHWAEWSVCSPLPLTRDLVLKG